jgi:hypothetical protein
MARSAEPDQRRVAVPETTSPDMLDDLIARADQNPALPLQDQMLLEQVRDELPSIQTMQPVGETGVLPPSARGVVPMNPMDIVSSWLYRSNTGNPSPEARQEVEDLLARIEQGKRSETEQQRAPRQRDITAEERPGLRGTPLARRRTVTEMAPTGETRTQVQADIEQDPLGQIFDSFDDFDNYLASQELDTMRQELGEGTETAARAEQNIRKMQTSLKSVEDILGLIDDIKKPLGAPVEQARLQLEQRKKQLVDATQKLQQEAQRFEKPYLEAYNAVVKAQAETTELQKDIAYLQKLINDQIKMFNSKAERRNRLATTGLQKASEEFKAALEKMAEMSEKNLEALRQMQSGALKDFSTQYASKQALEKQRKEVRAAQDRFKRLYIRLRAWPDVPTEQAMALTRSDEMLARLIDMQQQLRKSAGRLGGLTRARNRLNKVKEKAFAEIFGDSPQNLERAQREQDVAIAQTLVDAAVAKEEVFIDALIPKTGPLSVSALQEQKLVIERTIGEVRARIRQAQDRRTPARRAAPAKRASPTDRRRAEQARLETLQGTSPEQAGLIQRIQVVFPKDREARVESKAFFEVFEAKEYTRIQAALAPASERAAAQQAAQAAQQAYDTFVEGKTKKEKARIGAMNKAGEAIVVRDRELRETKTRLEALQATQETVQAEVAARAEKGKAPLKEQTKQLASLEKRIKEAQEKIPAQQKAVANALTAFQRASGVQATYREDMLPVRPMRNAAEASQEIEAIAAGQTQRRATSAVTRDISATPSQLRTGTQESRDAKNRAEVDRKAFESTQPKSTTRSISKKDMAEANRLADVLKMTPKQKEAVGDDAAAVAREVQKRIDFVNQQMEAERQKRAEARDKAAEKAKKGVKTFTGKGQPMKVQKSVEGIEGAIESAVRDTVYESRPTFDLRPATAEMVRDGRVLDALGSLEKVGSTDTVKQLAARLRPLMMRTKLRVVDNLTNAQGVPVEGLYDPNTNTVFIDSRGLNEEALLHELTHAATINALRADPASLTPEQRQAIQDLRSLFEQAQNDTAFTKEYAIKNLEEFVAELMSNQKVRNKLDAMKPANQPSLLQRIYDAIMRVFGAKGVPTSEKAMADVYAIFAPSKPSTGAVVASITRGVFPSHKPQANANAPASFLKGAKRSAASTSFGDKLSAFALGMRTKIADQYAAREALLKMGLKGGKLSEMQVMQSRINMRMNTEANRFVQQAMLDAPLALVKDEKGLFGMSVDEKRPGYVKVLETLRSVDGEIGNIDFTEKTFQTLLQLERAETDGVGYERMNMENPYTAAEARQFKADIAARPKLKAAFDKARTQYREYNNGMLDFARDAGVFTDKEVATFKKGNYVPYYRLDENTGNVTLTVGGSSPRTIGNVINQPQLKELVGGSKEFVSLTESVLQNTQLLTRMALQNLQSRDVGFMLENLGLGKIIDGEGTAQTIRFKIDGKSKWVKLNTDLFPADIPADVLLQGLHGVKAVVPGALQAMGIPTRLLRKTIVRMPLYIIRQMIRDPLHAWFTTGLKFTPVVDSVKEMAKMYQGKSESEIKLMRSGAVSSNVMAGDFSDAARTLRDLKTDGASWNKMMQTLDNAAMRADASTRAVLYDKYRQQGMSHFEAALGAAEVMNFSRRGTSSSLYMMSTLVPFFNAQIQGIDSIYRGFKGDTVFENQLDVRNKLVQRSVFMAALTMAYALAMQDDESYKNATPQERAMNWFLPVPGIDASVRVPIPFEIGVLTKSIPEILFNAGFGDASSGDTLKGLQFALGMSVPSPVPTAAAPILELATNYSFFRDAPIESQRDKAVAPEMRYRENTTELAKLMGKLTGKVGVSPVQLEHFVRGYTSTAGILAMSMFNPLLRPFTADERGEKAEKRITETPFFGAAFQPDTGRGIIDSVYDDVQDWQQAAGTFKRLVKEGRVAEARAYADKKSREIALSSTGGSFRQMMGELADMRRAIEADPSMSAKEKRDRIEDLKKYQIQLATKIREMSRMSE